ncbi:MAG: carbohydrate-binding family 9-like protein [Acidobacteria bacterium]|nr:carbohydrate-binding family 9-like protein [Acidobacteriota bacterium]
MKSALLLPCLYCVLTALPGFAAEETCQVASPTASFSIPHRNSAPALHVDPHSATWKGTASSWIVKDCTVTRDYQNLKTEVRAFWTDADLYLLFICPYETLNLWLPAMGGGPRNKLWDRDVVEAFLGDDWTNIRHYQEFEVAPTGDWIDLAIDLDKQNYDQSWRSGWQTAARIDKKSRTWYAAARIPLGSVSAAAVKPGTRWRVNLYRIEGQGPDSQRHFLCWQPTCVVNRDPNHVPEHFGTLIFGK